MALTDMYPTLSSQTTEKSHDDYIHIARISLPKIYLRISFPALISLLLLLDSSIRPVIFGAMADAYINVGVFVAVTLLLYYAAESYFGFDISQLKAKPAWQQITVASILGALPGCGGAIIVVSQYAAGHMSFAALVTVLVATMGDAAFLLLAKAPETGFMVMGLGLVVGILSGLTVHALHSPEFMRQSTDAEVNVNTCKPLLPIPKIQATMWMLLLLVAFPFTLLSAFQVEVPSFSFFSLMVVDAPLFLGVFAAVMCLFMWALLPKSSSYRSLVAEDSVAVNAEQNSTPTENITKNQRTNFLQISRKVIHDTNFIMVWVIMAFLLFEIFIHYTGISLAGLFDGALWLAPLVGVVVGFLPGCGPQIIVASLYLQGVAPLSTLLGNAISNDGDALFPAMALAPKAAMLATLYSAIPAMMVAYAVYFFA